MSYFHEYTKRFLENSYVDSVLVNVWFWLCIIGTVWWIGFLTTPVKTALYGLAYYTRRRIAKKRQ